MTNALTLPGARSTLVIYNNRLETTKKCVAARQIVVLQGAALPGLWSANAARQLARARAHDIGRLARSELTLRGSGSRAAWRVLSTR